MPVAVAVLAMKMPQHREPEAVAAAVMAQKVRRLLEPQAHQTQAVAAAAGLVDQGKMDMLEALAWSSSSTLTNLQSPIPAAA
jgi:hypothetical protein